MWAGVRKVASGDNRSIFYHASRDLQAKLIVRSVNKCSEFCRNKKLQQLWSAMQDSRNALNRSRTGKKPIFICPDFWTDLNGCQQRLLFAWQLTQRKCSLCSQGISYQTLVKEFCIDSPISSMINEHPKTHTWTVLFLACVILSTASFHILYTSQLFLHQMLEINALSWLVFLKISRRLLKVS